MQVLNSRYAFLLFVLLTAAGQAGAQKFRLSAGLGYHVGVRPLASESAPFPSDRRYTLGSGISRQCMLQIFPDSSRWSFSAGLQHFSGNGTLRSHSQTPARERSGLMTANALRLLTRFAYHIELGRFDLSMEAGLVLPLMTVLHEETWSSDSSGATYIAARMRNYTTAGFSGGLGLSTCLSPRIRLFCNGDLMLLNASVKNRSVREYKSPEYASAQDLSTADRHFFYRKDPSYIRNNRDVLPALFSSDKPTDLLSYRQSYSQVGLQLGFQFLF